MKNKILDMIGKIKKLSVPGKVQAAIKIFLFVNIAVLMGVWLGIKIFFPNDFIISKINEQLFVKDLAFLSEDVDVSLLGNISFSEGTLMEKGSKVLTFSELSFSPSIFATLGGHPAGKLHLEDINSQGGELNATFDTSENPCYSLDASEIPLSLFKPFLGEVLLTGTFDGMVNLCSKETKYNGKVELGGTDVVLRGKVPTPMGNFDVGKIILGEIELETDVVESKADIKRLSIKGIFELEATGKINLNTRNFPSSRIDLEVNVKIVDMEKISENVALNLLVSQLSAYKGDSENSYAFSLKGFLNKPQIGMTQKKEREQKLEQRQQKKPSARPQRPQRQDRLPQRETLPQREAPAAAATENLPQNDDLKKKEDELKRKEEELKRQEEAAKEREEKMREEREQREKEEKERREQEERQRMDEEARIHAAQEEAMNEIRKVREEMEAAKKAREDQDENGETEQPKPSGESEEE